MDKKDHKDKSMLEDNELDQVAAQEPEADPEEPGMEQTQENQASEADPVAQMRDELGKAQQANQELKDKYLRLFAEFDNYKKRTIREKMDLLSTAAQDTISVLLPVLDDFDRAKKTAEDQSSTEVFSEGVQLVYNKLYSVLKQKGLERMETNGEVFDPEFHEAITEIPAPSEDLKGRIVDTIETGYTLKDKIIRHAKVVVGK